MAAGLGFKDFVTGEVLTAADVDGYLMQGIWVFASAAARSAAVTSPQEGNYSYLKDTNSTEYYTGSAWVAAGAVGKPILQIVTADTTTNVSITSSSYSDSGLSASITPTLSTSKILVMIMQPSYVYRGANAFLAYSQLLRGATQIAYNDRFSRFFAGGASNAELGYNSTFIYLDSPATTSATTYKTQYKTDGSAGTTIELQYNSSTSQIILMEIGA